MLPLLVLLAGLLVAFAPAFLNGPPLGHTGGFGEPNCTVCHFGDDVNQPGGQLEISNLPDRYAPDSSYTIQLMLVKEGMLRGGFQLSVRDAATGAQAGMLVSETPGIFVETSEKGITYAMHNRKGTELAVPDTARWHLTWNAPAPGPDSVVIHVAANAANGDDSQFDDAIYMTKRVIPIAP